MLALHAYAFKYASSKAVLGEAELLRLGTAGVPLLRGVLSAVTTNRIEPEALGRFCNLTGDRRDAETVHFDHETYCSERSRYVGHTQRDAPERLLPRLPGRSAGRGTRSRLLVVRKDFAATGSALVFRGLLSKAHELSRRPR